MVLPSMSSETGVRKMSPVNSQAVFLASIPDVPSNTWRNTVVTSHVTHETDKRPNKPTDPLLLFPLSNCCFQCFIFWLKVRRHLQSTSRKLCKRSSHYLLHHDALDPDYYSISYLGRLSGFSVSELPSVIRSGSMMAVSRITV